MLKGTPSGLRQFLAREAPLKMTKNAFCFTLEALFVSHLNFCLGFFGNVKKELEAKDKVNLKIYDVNNWNKQLQ